MNTSGDVIGIPTLAAASPQSGAQAQGIGFAIPANTVRDIAMVARPSVFLAQRLCLFG